MVTAVLSYGAGIGSTALLVAICSGKIAGIDPKSTLAVFADTGAERPWTYDYLPAAKEYCETHNVKFEIARPRYTLQEYVHRYEILPSRRMRWCTQTLKIRPIRSRALGEGVSTPYLQLIGFDASERNRIRSRSLFRDCEEIYPLIDLGWNRRDCADAILKAGLPLPKKSSCFCCPFQRLSSFVSLMHSYPELATNVRTMEETANRNRDGKPPFYLFREPVDRLLERSDEIISRASSRGTLFDDFGMIS